MITQSDGYLALIEYLSENLSLFEQESGGYDDAPTIKLFIRYQMVEQLVMIFNEHSGLPQEKKLHIIDEVDRVTDDLLEVFGRNLQHKIDQHQQNFIIDFASLLKNLFDAQLFESISD